MLFLLNFNLFYFSYEPLTKPCIDTQTSDMPGDTCQTADSLTEEGDKVTSNGKTLEKMSKSESGLSLEENSNLSQPSLDSNTQGTSCSSTVKAVKAVFQTLLGSLCVGLWPYISFGRGCPRGQFSADACQQTNDNPKLRMYNYTLIKNLQYFNCNA